MNPFNKKHPKNTIEKNRGLEKTIKNLCNNTLKAGEHMTAEAKETNEQFNQKYNEFSQSNDIDSTIKESTSNVKLAQSVIQTMQEQVEQYKTPDYMLSEEGKIVESDKEASLTSSNIPTLKPDS